MPIQEDDSMEQSKVMNPSGDLDGNANSGNSNNNSNTNSNAASGNSGGLANIFAQTAREQ